jgi:hypothetical protein
MASGMMSQRRKVLALGICLLATAGMLAPICWGQGQADPSTVKALDPGANSSDHDNSVGVPLLKNLVDDQKAIWTSPAHLRWADVDWLLPLGAAVGVTLATDTEVEKHLSNSPSRLKEGRDFSNYGLVSFAAVGGGLYLWGRVTHDEHRRETGYLAGEAAISSLAATYALQYSLGRERPLQANYQGGFWQGGDSFPSEHAAAAWAMASVVAHEYPGPLTTFLAYGLATAVSAARVDAKQHFPTDVVIGSALGWFVGQEVYRHHHDPDLGGANWETYSESVDDQKGGSSSPMGSPFVELDSWIYPAIERLAAMGYIHSEFMGMRPWTRAECARLVEEAGDAMGQDQSAPQEAERVYATLLTEFDSDLNLSAGDTNRSARLESVYAGATNISGQPLHDSYHFGQTIINDYGRPYEEGFNTDDGFSGYGTAGRYTLYVRGEYQYAPFAPGYSLPVRQTIASVDDNPLQAATPFATTNQFTLLDTYVSAQASNWDLSFGKQSLWWGPAEGGAFQFSDNAEPIYMFRASRVAPFQLPWIFSKLGPMKLDMFFGKLSGNKFPARPLIHGNKVSFKPTPNLELGITATTEFGGVGRALTPLAVLRSYFSVSSSDTYPANANPGKRTAGFDFSYRVPHARNWLTLYTDSLLPADNPTNLDMSKSPVYQFHRLAVRPGIYMPRVPRVPKMELRFEAVYTNPPTPRSRGGLYVYWNDFYHDLDTNKNNLIGDWIGREAMGFQGWSTYHFGRRDSLQFAYRNAKVSKDFIPNGETVNDGSVKLEWWLGNSVSLTGSVQYEKWLAPVLAPGPQTNWTSTFGFMIYPHSWSW